MKRWMGTVIEREREICVAGRANCRQTDEKGHETRDAES